MIRIENITKQYVSKHNAVTAIDGLSLSIGERGLVFLVGRSGCGKTTLLNLIGGMDAVTSGEITVAGRSLNRFRPKDYDAYRNTFVGFVFQDFNLIEELTVAENIGFALELQGKKPSDAAIEEVLMQVEMAGMGGRYPKELSGGQKQRIAIARALIKKPRLLLADEPTGALDETTGRQILELLKKVSRDTLVLIVSHDREFAAEYGDRVIELADGRLISDTGEDEAEESAAAPSVKSRLSMATCLKLAWRYLKSRKLRVAVVALLSVAALLMVGVTDLISAYDKQTAVISSLYENQTPYVTLTKEKGLDYGKGIAWYGDGFQLSDADVQALAAQTETAVKGVYKPPFGSMELSQNYGSTLVMNEHYGEYVPALSGFVEFTQAELDDFGFALLAGHLPTGRGNEIAVTDYVYQSFVRTGYCHYTGPVFELQDNGEKVSEITWDEFMEDPAKCTGYDMADIGNYSRTVSAINTPDDLIGKSIFIDSRNYTITGIVDTGFDESRYADLTADDFDSLLANELAYERTYGLACAAFVAPGKIGDIAAHNPQVITIPGMTLSFENQYIRATASSVARYRDVDRNLLGVFWPGYGEVLERNEAGEPIKLSDGEMLTELADNQIIAVLCTEQLMYNTVTGAPIPTAEKNSNLKMTLSYDDERTRLIGAGYEVLTCSGSRYHSLLYPIQSTIIVPDALFDAISQGREGRYAYAVSVLPRERADIAVFVQTVAADHGGIRYNLKSGVTYEIAALDEVFVSMANISRYVGIGLAVFAFAMLWHFTGEGIHRRRRPIGIMRAMGAGGWDVGGIFFTESLILIALAAVVSCLLLGGAAVAGNWLIKEEFGILTSLLSVGIRQIGLIVGLALTVSALASLIPIARLAAQKPIDVIRG